ncbi:MAG: oligosaccharide flippase family protein [Chitinophagaceae bacterium]|nr:oligosaccharide flippase family protein [Chitinophagaceae bacterium]
MAFVRQVSINSIYKGVYLLLQFIFTILISKLSGPEGLGIFTLVTVNANLSSIFTSLGISSGIGFQASKNDISTKALLKLTWLSSSIQLMLILVIEIIVFLISGKFLIWNSSLYLFGFAGIILFLTISISEKYFALYNGYFQLNKYNLIVTAITGLIVLICSIWLFILKKVPIESILIVFVFANVVQVILLHFFLSYQKKQHNNDNISWKRDLFSYSTIAFFSNCLYFIALRVDYWIIGLFNSKEQLGYYALAVRLSQLIWILPTLLAALIMPKVGKIDFKNQNIERLIRLIFSFNVFGALLLAFSSFYLIPLIFGKEFTRSILPFCLILPGIVLLSLQIILSAYFSGKGEIKTNLITSIVLLIVIILLDLLLIPRFGIIGASIASSFAYSISGLFTYFLYCRSVNYSFRKIIIDTSDLKWIKSKILSFVN